MSTAPLEPPSAEGTEKKSTVRLMDEWVRRRHDSNILGFLSLHKILVNLTKRIVLVLALLLVAVLMIWPFVVPEEKRLQIVFSDKDMPPMAVEGEIVDTNRMLKPRFHGMDRNNQPYSVVAEEAVQKSEEEVILKQLSGEMTLQDGKWYSISAVEGTIFIKAKKMTAEGDVSVFTDTGFQVHTAKAHADMEAGTATSETAVSVQGPPGKLEASGFKILNRGDEIYFTGPVKMTIYTDR